MGSRAKGLGRQDEMTYAWYDIVGSVGVVVIILTYVLLQIERLRSDSFLYSMLNAIGASLILISLYYSFNFPSFVVEVVWLVISLFGIGKYVWLRRGRTGLKISNRTTDQRILLKDG